MKKLFALLGVAIALNLGTLACKQTIQCAKAEEPISAEVVESEEPTTSKIVSYSDSEVVIDVDKEVSNISQTARDVCEVIKTFLNQKVVIGGISFSLGTVLAYVVFKGLEKIFKVRKDKIDKINENLQKKLGATEEDLEHEKQKREKLDQVVKNLVNNLKNENLQIECLNILNGKVEQVKIAAEETKESVIELKEQSVNVANDTQNKIKDILKR